MTSSFGNGYHSWLTITTRLNTDQPDALVLDEIVEGTDGVASTSDASHDGIRKFSNLLRELLLDLAANNSLEVADDGRERVGSDSRADAVVSGRKIGDPVTHGLVNGVLESLRSGIDGNDLE